jgi:hypothetical protein
MVETSQRAEYPATDAARIASATDASKHARLADRLIRAAVNQLRRTVGGQQISFFTGQPGFNQRPDRG